MPVVNGENGSYRKCVIKSFKHNGALHRMWLENWQVPDDRIHPLHASAAVWVMLNENTTIIEADGKEWISRVPAVSFFIPEQWFNIVALIEESGIRYYCNVASPPYRYGDVLTYIDYDLDVVVLPNGEVHELDHDEFRLHREEYRYGETVVAQVEAGLQELLSRISNKEWPFDDAEIYRYYEQWKQQKNAEGAINFP
ncbi:DUF402 domain-containing protein [Cohnella herbarum]|uniref:DUF402 domain-containing protein n=2 Tax=Cohnella herbarum TaxID=2728023 RepID=A0A7Z2VKY1_9BACL|nr:DUF402 domain-containing protein [Cohnella herbarum]